jgi:hypothetical protein
MRKFFILLITVFLLLAGLQLVFGETSKTNKNKLEWERLLKLKELTELRTENSRTFIEKDGRKTTYLSLQPLNYQDENGKFQPIDTTLASDTVTNVKNNDKRANFRHKSVRNTLRARFADDSDEGLVLEHGKNSIQFNIKHRNKRKAAINKNKIRYNGVFDNCDLEFTVLPGMVKDELIFSKVPSTSVISYQVDFNGLKHKRGKDGTIDLIGADGKTAFRLLPSVMFEKNNKKSFKQVDTRFHWEKGQLYCDLVLDMKWLKDKRRKYPIVIDPTVFSEATDWAKFLLHCPESETSINVTIEGDRPAWRGYWFTTYDNIDCWFKDLQDQKYFIHINNEYEGHFRLQPSPTPEIQSIAGHDYEVVVHGGRSAIHALFVNQEFDGNATAVIKYGSIFSKQKLAGTKDFFTPLDNDVITKKVEAKYPQTIRFNYVEGLSILQNGNPLSITSGSLDIAANIEYEIRLAPKRNGALISHYTVNIDFPYLTKAYESQITLGTYPGYIDSTIKAPKNSNLLLGYETQRNGTVSGRGLPSIKVMDSLGTIRYEKMLDLITYHFIHGGDIVALEQEKPYHLIISRGQNGETGWGHINLTTYIQQNQLEALPMPVVSNLTLIDQAGNPVSGYARSDYRLRFDYTDPEPNSLKEYTLLVQKSGSAPIPFVFKNLTVQNGQIMIPMMIGSMGFKSQDVIHCQITDAWDGFDKFSSDNIGCNFTIDDIPPAIADFNETLYENNTLNLNCLAQDNTNGSGLKERTITWWTNGGEQNSVTLANGVNTYSITDLPASNRVYLVFTAKDNLGNTTVKNKVLYTYPSKAKLVAPVTITGTNATKYQSILKVEKSQYPSPLYRVVRYRGYVSDNTMDYDTGYLDTGALSVVNSGPPAVSIVNPFNHSIIHPPANNKINVTIEANAYDMDGDIVKVEFYNGGNLLGTGTFNGTKYIYSWNNLGLGSYNITAKAYDNDGLTATSTPVNFSVVNDPPTVSITNGVSFIDSTKTVTINAIASDSDGTISAVQFYRDSTLLGTDTTYPYTYSFTWNLSYNTTYTLTAKAIDNNGVATTSAPVNIRYNQEQQQVNCHWYCDSWQIFGGCWNGWKWACDTVYIYNFVITNGTTPTATPTQATTSTPAPTQTLTITATPTPSSTPVATEQECYSIPDRPAQKHQQYVYRIYTKNGDKELYQDSAAIPVVNNAPEFLSIQPAPDIQTLSNGVIKLVSQATDGDDDGLWYSYSIVASNGTKILDIKDTQDQEVTCGTTTAPIQDGTYTWTITVKDNYGGVKQSSGTVQVDKTLPCVSFTINNGDPYTKNQTVNLTLSDISNVVDTVRISNNNSGLWTSYNASQTQISWNLDNTTDGTKIVYVQAHSRNSGQWGPTTERWIILDQTVPSISDLAFTKHGQTQGVYFGWTGGSDATSGLSGKVNIQKWENGQWLNCATNHESGSIEIAADGFNCEVKIQIQLIDNAGNVSGWKQASAHTLAAPVSQTHVVSNSGYSSTGGHFIEIQLTANGNDRYTIECTQNPGGGYSGPLTPGPDGTIDLTNTGLKAHETYKYRILTYNRDNEVTIGEEFAVTLKNNFITVPEGLSPSGMINLAETGFSFDKDIRYADPDGDNLTIQYYLSSNGNNYSPLPVPYVTGLSSGTTYWWYAIINDGHGGTCQTQPVSFMPDTVVPVITVDNTSAQYAREHKVNIQAHDNESGLTSLKYSINGSPLTDITGEIVLTTQGTNYLYVVATDKAGNVATYSHGYHIDHTPPICQNIQFLIPKQDGNYLASDSQIPIQWNAVDPETGVAQFKYLWSTANGGYDPSAMQTLMLLDQQSAYQTILPGDFEDGKIYYLYIQAQNYLGLTGPIVMSPPLLYDHTAPIVKIDSLSGGTPFSGQYYFTDLSKLKVTVASNDPDSGITKTEYALTENPNGDISQWYDKLADLTANALVSQGKTYYLAVRVTNGTNLTTVVYSDPVFMETTAPELTVTTARSQSQTEVYTAQIRTNDPETMVSQLQYCIGSAPERNDFSTGLPGTVNGWFTVNYPPEIYELRQYAKIPAGITYYITAKATNIAGISNTRSSSGTQVTGSGTTAPEVSDDGSYTSEKTTLHFSWNFAACPREITGYQYQIRSSQGVVKSWTAYNNQCGTGYSGQISLLVTGLNLVNNVSYYCDVRAIYSDGIYSDIGSSDGILVDYTKPVISSFTTPQYAGAKGIKLGWNAFDPESGIQCYLGLGTTSGTTDISKGWLTVGNLKIYQISIDSSGNAIRFENGKRYYATLMIENGAGLSIQQTSGSIKIDLTPPPVPIVLDDGSYTNRDDRLRANWKWTKPDPESGIREYQYTILPKRALTGGEMWFNSGLETDMELTGLRLVQGKTYYIAVKAINNAGDESVGFSDGILIDTTAPDPPQAIDSGDYSLSVSSLQATLLASDAESGISGYKVSLGTLDNPRSIIADQAIFANSGREDLAFNNLSLEEGKVYFFTISATNNANLASIEVMSDGIMVDSKPPAVSEVQVQGRYLSDPTRIVFDWQQADPFSPSGIIYAQYAISTDPNGTNLIWKDMDLSGTKSVTGLNLTDGSTYYVFVRVQNRAQAENNGDTWSLPARSNPITIDQTSPEIIKITTPSGGYTAQHFLLEWAAKSQASGITEYRYAVGSDRGATDLTDGWVTIETNQTSASFYRDDLPLGDSRTCYISVKAKSGAGIWSTVFMSDAIVTDLTPPVVTELNYGSNYYNMQDSLCGITINWAANDPETDIAAYRVAVVKMNGNTPLTGTPVPTGNNSGTILLKNLVLEENQTYYIAMQVRNGVGDWSEVKYSNGFHVDTTPPVLVIKDSAPELVTNSGQMTLSMTSSELAAVVVKLLCPDGREETQTINISTPTGYTFSQTLEGTYTLTLIPTDLAGNVGTNITQFIRLNAKPTANIGPDQTITKGATIHFNPEVKDSDGTVVEYLWDFGDGQTSTIGKPSHTYTAVGTYTVTLKVKDNDGKWSDYPDGVKAKCSIIVSNTYFGTLCLDEDWEGEITISGDVIVPHGITLTVKAGTRIDFTGYYKILVNGKIIINGIPSNPVTIGGSIYWNGIRLEQADPGSLIQNATIQKSPVGLVIYNSTAQVIGSTFNNNEIGLHIVHSNPLVQNCNFENNLIYGVKEDDGAEPVITGCSFVNNGAAAYYEDRLGIISMDTLNQQGNNRDNH